MLLADSVAVEHGKALATYGDGMNRFNWSAAFGVLVAIVAAWFSVGWECAVFGFLGALLAIEMWN